MWTHIISDPIFQLQAWGLWKEKGKEKGLDRKIFRLQCNRKSRVGRWGVFRKHFPKVVQCQTEMACHHCQSLLAPWPWCGSCGGHCSEILALPSAAQVFERRSKQCKHMVPQTEKNCVLSALSIKMVNFKVVSLSKHQTVPSGGKQTNNPFSYLLLTSLNKCWTNIQRVSIWRGTTIICSRALCMFTSTSHLCFCALVPW